MGPETTQQPASSGAPARIALVVCLALAVVAGYFVFQKLSDGTDAPVAPANPAPGEPFDFPALSAQEQEILNTPMVPTEDGLFTLASPLVAQIAASAETLAMGEGCRMHPSVVKTKKGTPLQVRNYDSVPHTVIFGATRSYEVAPGGTATIPVDFGTAGEAYAYGCEADPVAKGVVLVAE